MKRKDVSARILTGVLAFSMVAATGTPSMAVFAAEESAVEAEQNTGEEVKSENETAQAYQYAYAALSWAEYWKNEDVYNAGSTESSAEEQKAYRQDFIIPDAVNGKEHSLTIKPHNPSSPHGKSDSSTEERKESGNPSQL